MKNLLYHPLAIITLTLLCVLFIVSLRKTAQKSEVSSQNVQLLEEKINQLSGEIELEKQAIEYAQSDLAQEKRLRDELLLQKSGEYILQIPEEKELKSGENSEQQQSKIGRAHV